MPPATHTLGYPFIELRSVDSTNNYAMALVHEGLAQHGLAIFSHEQTRGKGQRQKVWFTGKNQNIALSLIIAPDTSLALSQLFLFNMAIALGAHRFFSQYAGEETKIKWPNDIYWRDRKAGGILIENSIKGVRWNYAIAGIGLNINQTTFGELNTKAVSLKQITGKNYDTVVLARELCTHVNYFYQLLLKNPDAISQHYHQHLYKLNEVVQLKKGEHLFEAKIKGVNEAGQLIVQHGVEEVFNTGDIEWVI